MTMTLIDLVHALVRELRQRRAIRQALRQRRYDQRTLDDIGMSFKQLEAAMWDTHRDVSCLRAYLDRLESHRTERRRQLADQQSSIGYLGR